MNTNAMNNHADATVLLTALNEQASILAGCSQEGAWKMLDILTMAVVKLELLVAIEEEIQNAYDAL